MLQSIDAIIAGAGLTGLTAARSLAEKGKKVLVVEKQRHIGGHCYDSANGHGIRIQHYGPHIFHTGETKVWEFLSRFTDWFYYQHKVKCLIDGQLVPLPFNLNSLYLLFPPQRAAQLENALLGAYEYNDRVSILDLQGSEIKELRFLGDYVYRKVFLHYTMKQWGGARPQDIDPKVIARVPVVISRNDDYFDDPYQGIPLYGFTAMMENIAAHENIHLMLNTDIHDLVVIKNKKLMFCRQEFKGQFIYTGPIDELFDEVHGRLPYRSLRFESETFYHEGFYNESSVINYPCNYDFTRITEYKQFQRSEHQVYTTVSKEFPCDYEKGRNNPYYVVNNPESWALYNKYKHMADEVGRLHCLGRLGEYKYYNMDQAVGSALKYIENLLR